MKVIRLKTVAEKLDVKKTTIYDWARKGLFPKPTKIGGGRASVWLESEVDAWIEAQFKASREATEKGGCHA